MSRFTQILAGCAVSLALPSLLAQAVPASTPTDVQSRSFSPIGGELDYTLGVAGSYLNGYNGNRGSSEFTTLSGTAAYVSPSETHPLSFLYSGGYLVSSNSNQPSSTYQNLGISQVLRTKKWTFVAADFISYLPGSPVYGASGLPGLGDIGTPPIATGGVPVNSILTNYGTRFTNTVSGSAGRQITARASLDGSVSYGTLKFLGSPGLDSHQFSAAVGPSYRINPRNTIGANYSYGKFLYPGQNLTGQIFPGQVLPGQNPGQNFSFTSQSVNVSFEHVFTRRLSLVASAGPQFIKGSPATLIPSRLDAAVSIGLSYTAALSRVSLGYSRGTVNGSGVFPGAVGDNLNVTVGRTFSRNWDGAVLANYGRSSGLGYGYALGVANTRNSSISSVYGGVQASRRLGRLFSAYGSYNLQKQIINGSAPAVNAFNGFAQILSIGLTFTPRPIHLGHR